MHNHWPFIIFQVFCIVIHFGIGNKWTKMIVNLMLFLLSDHLEHNRNSFINSLLINLCVYACIVCERDFQWGSPLGDHDHKSLEKKWKKEEKKSWKKELKKYNWLPVPDDWKKIFERIFIYCCVTKYIYSYLYVFLSWLSFVLQKKSMHHFMFWHFSS